MVRISVFTGTKAQFIKMVPVVRELERRGLPYRLIDTGQHGELIHQVVERYELRKPDIRLSEGKGVSSIGGGLLWMLRLIGRYVLGPRESLKSVFGPHRGYALVHGDTASTLVSALIARRGGQEVAHIEAGLRSWDYLNPFPEEVIRVIVMRMASVLFAPSEAAMGNLRKMKLNHMACKLPGNTLLDTVRYDLARADGLLPDLPRQYSVVTLHRLETLYRRRMLRRAVGLILDAHRRVPVVFVAHEPTMKQLEAAGLLERLSDAGVRITRLINHATFLALIDGAEFLLTDGGSIQEEASYIGVPTLLLRYQTERDEGLNANVLLSRWELNVTREFLENYRSYRRKPLTGLTVSPSREIVDELERLMGRSK